MSKRPGDPGYPAQWCIHYRSTANHNSCKAGINYSTWRGPDKAPYQPCFLDRKTGESKPDALPCEHLRRPTPEEIAAHRAWQDGRVLKFGTVMAGIADWRRKHQGRSHAEIVECPACKGRLHLSISASNGHLHGRCETEDCVSWME